MKTLLIRALSWAILLGLWLVPTACRNTLDFQLATVRPVLPPSSKANVTVTGPIELNGRLYVIDSMAAGNIVSYSGNTLVLKTSITLRSARTGGTAAIGNLAVGDFIAADVSEKAPRGLLKKVTDKTSGSVDGEVGFTVEDATFEGIFKKINLAIEGTASATIQLERSLEEEIKKGILVGTGTATLKGSYKAEAAVKVELKVDEATLQRAATTVSLTRTAALGISSAGALKLAGEPELLRKALPPLRGVVLIPTPLGFPLPLPIVITPDFVVKLKLETGMEGAIDLDLIKLEDKYTYGVEYNRGKGFNLIKEEQPVDNKPEFTVKASGFLEAALRPELEFSFYDLKLFTFGVGAELFGRLEGTCNLTTKELELKLSSGLRGNLFARWNVLTETFKPETEKERTVQGAITFAVVAKKVNSTFCGASSDPDPIANSTSRTSTALSTGDPHLNTFDQFRYDLMSVGEFVAVRATAADDPFEVQVRQQPQGTSTTVSINTGLAIRSSGGDRVCIYPNRVYVDGQDKGLSFSDITLNGGSQLHRNASGLILETPTGDQINVRFFGTTLDYDLRLAPSRKGKVKGIFGNFDDQTTNDLVRGDNGQAVKNTFTDIYPLYADSWRIQQAQSLFIYDAGKTTITYTDRTFPRTAVTLTAQQRADAKSICEQAGVTDPVILENCITDVAMTNDRSYADRAQTFQLATTALNSFAIGQFSTSDVQLEYLSATAENRAAVLTTRNSGFSRMVMHQGVNIQRGFVSEFSFSTAELDPSSCFYLALWPTDTKTRNGAQKRIGFCFGTINGQRSAFINYADGSPGGLILGQSSVPDFIDGQVHKVRIVERNLPNGTWQLDMFLDNLSKPVSSVTSNESIAERIDSYNRTGYIEFQINQGSPSTVRLFNWLYNAY